MEQKSSNSRLINGEQIRTFIGKRDRGLHKGDCGTVLIIAGSKGMAGAAILCARAALRAGAGLVRVSVPDELFPILQCAVPEATCLGRTIPPDLMNSHEALLIGPGLGADTANEKLIESALTEYTGPLILDADALNILSRSDGFHRMKKTDLVITPHTGEAARLLACTRAEIEADREGAVTRLAQFCGGVAVLKGAGTLVASTAGETYKNTTGNPGMATGGSGDVLAGIILALAGQGLSCEKAAIAGVYLHGLAGDLTAQDLGEYGMTAADLADGTAIAFKNTLETDSNNGK